MRKGLVKSIGVTVELFKDLLKDILQYMIRKKDVIIFNDLNRISPVGSKFGINRGTPIDRYYIENFLRKNSSLIKGRILEVGSDSYSRKMAGSKAESFDILHVSPTSLSATLVGDLTDMTTLPENAFDCFICTSTFNFIFDVQKAVEGAHHLLKPGGVLLATVAGISQISRYDMDRWGDYWRFTSASVKRLFAPVFKGGLEIESFGNVLAATAFLQGVAVEDLPEKTLLDQQDPDYQMLITILAKKAS